MGAQKDNHSCRGFKEEFAHLRIANLRKPYSSASAELKKEGNEWKFIYNPLRSGVIKITIKFCPFCGEKLKTKFSELKQT